MGYFEIIRKSAIGRRKERPNRWLVAIFLLFIASGRAFADQADDDFHKAHGDIKGADGYWKAPGNPTDAELAQMKAEWDRKWVPAEAARVAFIAKGDFSPAAAQAFADKAEIRALGAPMTVTHNPKTLDGEPVGLSIDEPKPETPKVETPAAEQKVEEPKREIPKYEPSKTLISYEKLDQK